MRVCVGLVLSAAAGLAAAPGAGATTYCIDPGSAGAPECIYAASPQQALNIAAAHPGFDTVVLGPGTYDVGAGLGYSDGGSADNGLRIESRTQCPNKYTCNTSTLRGGAPGAAVLSLSAPGGADVRAVGVTFQPEDAAAGLALGPGARAQGGQVRAGESTTGIRLEGIASAPAIVSGYTSLSGSIAVDAPGHGIVENAFLSGLLGVRVTGAGSVDIRGGSISTTDGVTGSRVRIAGTAITFGQTWPRTPDSSFGVEAVCDDEASADASVDITNATIAADPRAGGTTTGVRAAGRGGDGAACDATVRMSSTIVHNTDVSLDVRGAAGSGADPRDGNARIEAAYSDFSAAAARVSGPATLETSSPGQNVDTDPGFVSLGYPNYPLFWTSPLINAGDPAQPEEWQQPYIEVAHGRRDIGESEYGFHRPELTPSVYPPVVATGARVDLYSGATDADPGDPLEYVWTFPDRSKSSEESLTRRFYTTGRYVFHVRVTDPTGQVAEADLTARVVEQRLSDLRVRPARFRAARRRSDGGRVSIRFRARAADTIVFRVHRATHRRGSSRIRWRRVPRTFEFPAYEGAANSVPFNGWLRRHRLRPGLYRLIARGRSDGTAAGTRFRILR